jgi:type III restriction enzyme
MIFKKYQKKVASEISRYFKKAVELRDKLADVEDVDWVHSSFSAVGLQQIPDSPQNGLGELFPRFTIKVPTGGGKTLLAVDTIRQYQELFVKRRYGLVVWVVPSEIIYSQTVEYLRDKSHPYRQMLDQASGGNTIIVEKGQEIRKEDVEGNLVVLMLMIQSVSRATTKESLKVFMDSGSYDSFFPEDNRYDLHKRLLEQVPNLDVFQGVDSLTPQVKTSLGNVVRMTNSLMIIDEIHRTFTPTAKSTINSLNPEMVVGFSATPKMSEMNILISISGQELKEEEMIKLDLNIKAPTQHEDWQTMIKEIKDWREELEKEAESFSKSVGDYIRPIALIQVERTGKEQRGKGYVHSEDCRDYLVEIGVPDSEIAIKTSSKNDIEDVDILSKDCPIRYIITRDALKEGWDCPFAYVLGIIPNVNSNTGVTQLVGRILRQPYGKKTKVQRLDESYVFYTKGQTQKILTHIKNGFSNEGLGDLVKSSVKADTDDLNQPIKSVKIRKSFKEKYVESLYLPVWLVSETSKTYRPFNYSIDIRPHIDFRYLELKSLVDGLTLSDSQLSRTLIKGDLEQGELEWETEREVMDVHVDFDIAYLTRRLTDIVDNAFVSRAIALELYKKLKKRMKDNDLNENAGYIVSEIVKQFQQYKNDREEEVFNEIIGKKKLVLAVSDEEIGYRIPETETMKTPPFANTYKYYLYEDFDITSVNGLEADVASLLDKQKNIVWWMRNKVTPGWYAIQGWREGKVRPDFVAAKKNAKGGLDLIYVIESKGEHLKGNEDTQYKQKLLSFMNDVQVKKVKSTKLVSQDLNDSFVFELVEQDKYENRINTVMKGNEKSRNLR